MLISAAKRASITALTLLLVPSAVRAAERAHPLVTLVAPRVEGEVNEGVRGAVRDRLLAGLRGSRLRVVDEQAAEAALGPHYRSCGGPPCWKLALEQLHSRYVVGGSINGEDRSYIIELWVADAHAGKVAAKVRKTCNICGLNAVAEKMELAASALAAKLAASARAPARIALESEPPGALVKVDGRAAGHTPRELVRGAGTVELVIEAEGYLPHRRKVTLVGGVNERLTVRLIPLADRRSRGLTIGSWSAVGAAAASFALASVLFSLDGAAAGCSGEDQIPGGQCPERLETTAGAWTAAGIGVGAALAGGYLLYRLYFRKDEDAGPPGGAARRTAAGTGALAF
jgi:hypothetical protein